MPLTSFVVVVVVSDPATPVEIGPLMLIRGTLRLLSVVVAASVDVVDVVVKQRGRPDRLFSSITTTSVVRLGESDRRLPGRRPS